MQISTTIVFALLLALLANSNPIPHLPFAHDNLTELWPPHLKQSFGAAVVYIGNMPTEWNTSQVIRLATPSMSNAMESAIKKGGGGGRGGGSRGGGGCPGCSRNAAGRLEPPYVLAAGAVSRTLRTAAQVRWPRA